MTMEGKKFSSSRGIVIYVKDILARYPVDAVRYYISVAGPESSDSDFTWAEFVRHNNEELAASWGNLVNRVANLMNKNFGEIPALDESEMTDEDRALLSETKAAFDTVGSLIENHRQKNALSEAMRVVGDINKYISATEPWKIKDNPARLGTVLHVAAQAVSDANHLLAPFLPHSAQKVWEALGGTGTFSPLPRWKRSRISTSRASCIRSSPATTSWAKPCIRGLPSRSWPALQCRSRIRFSRRFRRRR